MSTNTPLFAILAAALTDNPHEAPRLARGAGFAGLLFDAYSARFNIPDLTLSGRRDFRHMLAAQDEQLSGLRVDIGIKGISIGADIDRVLARLDRVMECAVGLSCRQVCVDPGPLPEPPHTPISKPAIKREHAGLITLSESLISPAPTSQAEPTPFDATAGAQVDAALLDLGRRADRYGVTIAFRNGLASFAALERALVGAACPWFAVDLDPVAILRDGWALDEVFSRLGKLVRHVCACDAVLGSDRRTRPSAIGQGSTNWGEFLSALEQAGYQGWITIDPTELTNRTAAATVGLEYLRNACQ